MTDSTTSDTIINSINTDPEFYTKIDSDNIDRILSDEGLSRAELVNRLKAASVYIDNRSIGNYFEKDAQVHGNVSSKQQFPISHISQTEIAGTISNEYIEKINSVYICTDYFGIAESILLSKHVLILSGRARYGKQTTAIRLLSSLTRDILEIIPVIDDFHHLNLKANSSYYIDNFEIGDKSKRKLTSYILKKLSLALQKLNSFLVITLDEAWKANAGELNEFTCVCADLPNTNHTLERHVKWYLKERPYNSNDIDRIIGSHSVHQIINDKLLPGDIDQLAELIARVITGECDIEKALSNFNKHIQDVVENWFRVNKDFTQRMFLISLAVLNGCKYSAVEQSAHRLATLALSENDSSISPTQQSLFNVTRTDFLKSVQATLTQGYENTERGMSPVEIVVLDNTRYQPTILHFVWHEYSSLREPLLSLLSELGVNQATDIRIRVATALGEISKFDFSAVLDNILRPWASSPDQRLRELVALALCIPVFESTLAPQVLNLLHHWSRQRSNQNLQLTSILAYGNYIGFRFPDLALSDLLLMGESANESIFSAVANSFRNLFESGDMASLYYQRVLERLISYIGLPEKKQKKAFGILMFCVLLRCNHQINDVDAYNIPTFLWLLIKERESSKQGENNDSSYQNMVIILLRASLDYSQSSRKQVFNALHKWITYSDLNTEYYPVLGSLLFKIVLEGTNHERDRLIAFMEKCSSSPSSRVASAILCKIRPYV